VQTYSAQKNTADWQAVNLRYTTTKTCFDVELHGEIVARNVTLELPGEHNVGNALAAVAVAKSVQVDVQLAADALATFKTTARRFDVRAEQAGIVIIDDYAHHPTAVKMTVNAAVKRYPDSQIWAVWQPHSFSRTKALWDDFLTAFQQAHHVLVTDVFNAREVHDPSVDMGAFSRVLQHPGAVYTPTIADAVSHLSRNVLAPAVILIMSAGDGPQIGADYLRQMKG